MWPAFRFGVQAGFWLAVLARDLRGLLAPRQRRGRPLADVNIEPTNLCNANCVFCGYQFQERPWVEIDPRLAARIIQAAKQAGVERLGLTPIVGEPLVHRRLEEIIRLAVQEPVPLRVGLTTNGILLTPARYRSLVEAGIASIDVSLSFPDEEEYRRIYRSPRLKTLMDNLEGILDTYRPGECQMTLALRTGRYWRWDDHSLLRRARTRGWMVTRNLLFDDWSGLVVAPATNEGLLIRPNRPKVLPCTMTFAGPHFLSDGRATACGCRDLDGKGDLALSPAALLTDMAAVYQTGAVHGLRERFREGRPPALCVSCRHYNPTYEGEAWSLRLRQLVADARAILGDTSTETLPLRPSAGPSQQV